MIQKQKIMLQLPGMVLFDPYNLEKFIRENEIQSSDLFQHFQTFPHIGDEAIADGVLLPIYTIPQWDYDIIINDTSEIHTEKALIDEIIEIAFPLKVTGEKLIMTDIFGLMNLEIDYFKNFPLREDRTGVDADFEIANGNYAVTIIKFIDRKSNDIENRTCGYELLLKAVDKLPSIPDFDIDQIPYAIEELTKINQ